MWIRNSFAAALIAAAVAAPAFADGITSTPVTSGAVLGACGASSGNLLYDNAGACAGLVTGTGVNTLLTGNASGTGGPAGTISPTFTGAPTFNGQITTGAGTPTIASGACGTGTNGAVVAGSTNQSGQITIGAATTTTCTITWSATLASAPKSCVFFPMNATAAATGTTVARVGAPSTGSVVLTGSALASANYAYLCL